MKSLNLLNLCSALGQLLTVQHAQCTFSTGKALDVCIEYIISCLYTAWKIHTRLPNRLLDFNLGISVVPSCM